MRMRLLVDSLIALTLVAVLGGVLWHRRAAERQVENVEATQQSLRAIEAQALYRGSLGECQTTWMGYPLVLKIEWFEHRPANLLADNANWLDIVEKSKEFESNPDHVTCESGRAAFWYNPYRGIVRARVAPQMSAKATIDLYNLVNGTSLRVDDSMWAAAE
jgi:type II secretory pathway pseudopilin PulG